MQLPQSEQLALACKVVNIIMLVSFHCGRYAVCPAPVFKTPLRASIVRDMSHTLRSSTPFSKTGMKFLMTRSTLTGSLTSCSSPKYSDTLFMSACTAFSRACKHSRQVAHIALAHHPVSVNNNTQLKKHALMCVHVCMCACFVPDRGVMTPDAAIKRCFLAIITLINTIGCCLF